jgi:endonuclease G, mitochondrial
VSLEQEPVDPNDALRRRVARTLGRYSLEDLRKRYRAIVGPSGDRDRLVQSAMAKLKTLEDPTAEERTALEEAIRMFRPSIASRKGELAELPPGADGAFAGWPAFAERYRHLAYAVGRIDLPRDPGGVAYAVGTGFLVRPEVLVTNRHVVRALERGTDAIVPGEATVSFGQERQTTESRAPARVLRVLAEHSALDLALLALEPPPLEGRPVLELDLRPAQVGDAVVVIGYPCEDPVRNPMFARQVFPGGYYVKQAAPGEVIATFPAVIHHDCSTLGGNSGSPVLSLSSARVVGTHFWGGFLLRNEAVDGASLRDFVSSKLG